MAKAFVGARSAGGAPLPSAWALRLGTAAAVITICLIAVAAVAGDPITYRDGCGPDGGHYCGLAAGEVVREPYSNRVLIPWVVGSLVGSGALPLGFFVVNLVSLLAFALGSGVLASRIASALGASGARASSASFAAAALTLVPLMALRFTSFYPVLIDHPASALLLWWVVMVTDRRARVRDIGVVLGILAILAKESTIIPIAIIVVPLLRHPRSRRAAIMTVVSACAALVFVLSRPGSPNPNITSLTSFMWGNVTSLFTVRGIAANLLWGALLSLGLLPVIVVKARRALAAAAANERLAPLPTALWCLVFAPFVVVALAGADSTRYLYQSVPPLLALAVGAVAADPRLDRWFAGSVAATILLARPFEILDGSVERGEILFAPIYAGEEVLLRRATVDGVALAAVAGVVMIFGLFRRIKLPGAGAGPVLAAGVVPPEERAAGHA